MRAAAARAAAMALAAAIGGARACSDNGSSPISSLESAAAKGGLRIVEQADDIVEIAGKVGEHEIRVLANMSHEGGTLFLRQAHIQGPGAGKVGVKALLDAAKEFGRSEGADKVVIEGAKRTTGAGNQRGAVPRAWEIVVD